MSVGMAPVVSSCVMSASRREGVLKPWKKGVKGNLVWVVVVSFEVVSTTFGSRYARVYQG